MYYTKPLVFIVFMLGFDDFMAKPSRIYVCKVSFPFLIIFGVKFLKRLLKYTFHQLARKCYINLRNIGRIGSKLHQKLKIQLVHSLVLSHID